MQKKWNSSLPKGQVAAFFKTLGEELQQGGAEGSPANSEGLSGGSTSSRIRAALPAGQRQFPSRTRSCSSRHRPGRPGGAHDEGEPTETGVDQAEVTAGPGPPWRTRSSRAHAPDLQSLAASLAVGTPPLARGPGPIAADSRLMCAFPPGG